MRALITGGKGFVGQWLAAHLKACNDEWNKMKEDKTVGDKKYADFRKECLAREAPADAGSKTATTKSGGAVFPGSVSSKYSTVDSH